MIEFNNSNLYCLNYISCSIAEKISLAEIYNKFPELILSCSCRKRAFVVISTNCIKKCMYTILVKISFRIYKRMLENSPIIENFLKIICTTKCCIRDVDVYLFSH